MAIRGKNIFSQGLPTESTSGIDCYDSMTFRY